MKKYLIALAFVALIGCGYKALEKSKAIICSQQYALCTSAQCIPDPDHPDKAICFCEVREGKSLGETPCDERVPHTDQYGIRHVISTFSFDDAATKKVMTCPEGTPWTDCLDQPCVVDPLDPSKAICMCKVIRTGAYQTYGGGCEKTTCDKGYWSGATIESNAASTQALITALGLKQTPVRFCPE